MTAGSCLATLLMFAWTRIESLPRSMPSGSVWVWPWRPRSTSRRLLPSCPGSRVTWLVTTRRPSPSRQWGGTLEESAARRLGQTLDGVKIHAEIDLRGHIVHVLTAGTGGAGGTDREGAPRDPDGLMHDNRLAHGLIFSLSPWGRGDLRGRGL